MAACTLFARKSAELLVLEKISLWNFQNSRHENGNKWQLIVINLLLLEVGK